MNDLKLKHAKALVLLANSNASLKVSWQANRLFTAIIIMQMAVIIGLVTR